MTAHLLNEKSNYQLAHPSKKQKVTLIAQLLKKTPESYSASWTTLKICWVQKFAKLACASPPAVILHLIFPDPLGCTVINGQEN